MRTVIIIFMMTVFAFCDVSVQTNKNQTEQDVKRQQEQMSNQTTKNRSRIINKGREKSSSQTATRTQSNIDSKSSVSSMSINTEWSENINPIPYLLNGLRELGWDRRCFFLSQDDIGSVDFIVARDDEYGTLQNVGKLQAAKNNAETRQRLGRKQIMRLRSIINQLYFTAELLKNAVGILKNTSGISADNFKEKAKQALRLAYQRTRTEPPSFRDCHFGGNINTYICGYGKYTLVLTPAMPNLYINGGLYYSSSQAGYNNQTLKVSIVSSHSQSVSSTTQTQNSKSVASIIRDYTSKLEQEGRSDIATKIKNKFIEKSLTNSLSTNRQALVQAINSGSPISVLKIFK